MFSVGDRVYSYAFNSMGTITKIDSSNIPYCIRLDNPSGAALGFPTYWHYVDDVASFRFDGHDYPLPPEPAR